MILICESGIEENLDVFDTYTSHHFLEIAYLLPDEVVRLVGEMPDMDPSFTHGLPDTNGNVFEQVDSNLEHIFQNAISNPGRFPIFQMMRMALLRLVEQVSI